MLSDNIKAVLSEYTIQGGGVSDLISSRTTLVMSEQDLNLRDLYQRALDSASKLSTLSLASDDTQVCGPLIAIFLSLTYFTDTR